MNVKWKSKHTKLLGFRRLQSAHVWVCTISLLGNISIIYMGFTFFYYLILDRLDFGEFIK